MYKQFLHVHKNLVWRASFGRFICILGLNSSLSSPTSEQVCKRGGGGDGGIAPGNRLLATDHGLAGFPDLKVNQGLDL